MEIQCEFVDNKWTYSGYHKNKYTCRIQGASITKRTEISKFIGEHVEGRSNKDVTAIVTDKSAFQYFPRNLHKIFPNLETLDFSKCGVLHITRNDLVGLENLEDFNLNKNKLSSLPSDLFTGMNIRELRLQGNRIEFMSSEVLKPLGRLKYVDFRNNDSINTLFAPEDPSSVASLQELMEIIDKECKPPNDKGKEEFAVNFTAGFNDLWTSKEFADFTIVGGTEEAMEFKVHRNVLAAQSPVMFATFKNDMKEKETGKMIIDDFSVQAVEGMLRFIYTGEIQEKLAMDLYAIACKYEVRLLRERTKSIILCNIDESNALEIFGAGHLHNSEEIKLEAFNVIRQLFPHKKLPDELMKRPEDLKELVEAARLHQREIKETKEKYEAKLRMFDMM